MKAYEKNLTVGSELPAIVMFTLPMLAGNLFQQLYNVVDSVIVGKYLGSDALAAVGSTGSITYLFYTLCLGLGPGVCRLFLPGSRVPGTGNVPFDT